MGAPFAFECRRQELQELGLSSTDEDVVQSFLDLIDINSNSSNKFQGLLLEYMVHGKLALIAGDTIFVHGAIVDSYMG
jgi:hypothetical protein